MGAGLGAPDLGALSQAADVVAVRDGAGAYRVLKDASRPAGAYPREETGPDAVAAALWGAAWGCLQRGRGRAVALVCFPDPDAAGAIPFEGGGDAL